jgi:hypothetical protein
MTIHSNLKSIFYILLIFPLLGWAVQKSDEAWSVLTMMGKKDQWVYMIEPQFRAMSGDTPINNQTLFNIGGGYQVSSQWQLWFGSTWTTTAQDTLNSNQEEYRLWEQAFWSNKWKLNTLSMRARLEERKSFDYQDWAYRFRDRFMASIPISNPYSFVLSDEFFVNLNDVDWITTGTWDSNRAYAGVWRQFSPSFSAGLGYLNQQIYTDNLQSDNVLVVNMWLNL